MKRISSAATLSMALLAGMALNTNAAAPAPAPVVEPAGMDILADVRIPMRDNIELSGRVWKSADNKPAPTVFAYTPYTSEESHGRASKFVDRGYAYISVDKRGRGASGGTYTPLKGAGPDGCDVIDWIKQQPWSNGQVVMRGGSYRGMVQWQIAAKCPDKLAAIVPTASVYPGEDFPTTQNQITYSYTPQWLAMVSGRSHNGRLFADGKYWGSKFREMYLNHRPFHELDTITGINSSVFDQWVNQLGDPNLTLWSNDNPTPAEMANINIPVLTITGHFDSDQPGALRYYRNHLAAASKSTQSKHLLLMGPWHHGGTRNPTPTVGGLQLGPQALLDIDALHLDYFDWVLRDGKRPEILNDQVVYYTTGTEQWNSAKRLDDANSKTSTFYLSAAPNEANDVFSSGHLLNKSPGNEESTSFKNDPLDVRPAKLLTPIADTWVNPRDAFLPEMRVFHSAALESPLTLSGQLKLKLFLEIDTPDTDIYAVVFAVSADGSTVKLGSDIMRARFREGTANMKLVEPGVVNEYVFDRFPWNSTRLAKGTRLRVVVGPLNDPAWQKNYNSGGRLGYETADDAKVATVRIHHSSKYPSRLELPVE